MANAFVQSKGIASTGTTSTTIAVTMTSNVTAGNLLAVYVAYGDATFVSCADTLGNTFTPVDDSGAAFNGDIARTFYAKNIAGGADTITCTLGEAVGYRQLAVHEISGAHLTAPLDQHIINKQSSPGTGTNAVTSTALTTTTNGQYIFGAARICGIGTGESVVQGTGFTDRESFNGGADSSPLETEDQIQTTAASIAATFTATGIGSDSAIVAMMTFIAAAAGSVSITPTVADASITGIAGRNDRGILTPTTTKI